MNTYFAEGEQRLLLIGLIAVLLLISATQSHAQNNNYEFNDSHFHLTNNVQEGPNIRDFLNMMGSKAGRVALFGIPLQQQWSYRVDGDRAPTYYLHSDAPLYYYSFTDAWIAMAYKSLTKEQQARFDPMITGFNPPTCTPRTTFAGCCRLSRAFSPASASSRFTRSSCRQRFRAKSQACRTRPLIASSILPRKLAWWS